MRVSALIILSVTLILTNVCMEVEQSKPLNCFSMQEYEMYKAARTFAKLCINSYKKLPEPCIFLKKERSQVLYYDGHFDNLQPCASLIFFNLYAYPTSNFYTPWGGWHFADLILKHYSKFDDYQKVFKQICQHLNYEKHYKEKIWTDVWKITAINGKPIADLELSNIPSSTEEARNRWNAMTLRYKFEKSSLKKLCLKFIRKHKSQFEANLTILPVDLREQLDAKK